LWRGNIVTAGNFSNQDINVPMRKQKAFNIIKKEIMQRLKKKSKHKLDT